ncbi:hypothetical protein J6590_041796 [Homalodisca vitripennis]|nr:hypothetical protein J6590_041796 [Homalodisca vitripennis]
MTRREFTNTCPHREEFVSSRIPKLNKKCHTLISRLRRRVQVSGVAAVRYKTQCRPWSRRRQLHASLKTQARRTGVRRRRTVQDTADISGDNGPHLYFVIAS